MQNLSFYVYVHRTESGQVFYVGKGHGRRAWSKKNRNFSWRRIVAHQGLVVELLHEGLQEDQAFKLEIKTIAHFGRVNLVNLTDGGEGVSGRKFSEESREKMRQKKLGKCFTETHRANLSKAKRGIAKPPFSPSHLANLRENALGRRVFCSNGITFEKVSRAKDWLRENGFPRASTGGICTAAKNSTRAYGFCWSLQGN